MKLIVAIVHDHDTEPLLRTLTGAGHRATRVAATGGYLRRGNAVVFLGVEDDEVAGCMQLIKGTCGERIQRVPPAMLIEGDAGLGSVASERRGGGVVFVTAVERFVRIDAPGPGAS